MSGDGGDGQPDVQAVTQELLALRAQVVELQRAAARHEVTEGVSLAKREELLAEVERRPSWHLDLGPPQPTADLVGRTLPHLWSRAM